MNAVTSIDVVEKLKSIEVPVLVLRASEDRVVPPSASKLILAAAMQADLEEFVAPHFLLQCVPDQAARIVREFLASKVPDQQG
ncbi:alpha/beta fold hydrolase [Caenimonas sedimenti]|uniref:alpha/beta fold hydrolase n=1 Tax=Caenimonas sedimenti TaxID=2596921 RepID=UPI001C949854|nr:lysophospholipase [Caenimonas sedimenti]